MSEQKNAVTAAEWRAKAAECAEVVELELPSGMTIRARRPGPMQYAGWGRLPMMLSSLDATGPVDVDATVEVARFTVELLRYCCVEPRIAAGDEAGPDEIAAREIPDCDWQAIVSWGLRLREAEALRSFRGGRAHGPDRGDSEDVAGAAVGADGDGGHGAGAGVRHGGGAADMGDGGR